MSATVQMVNLTQIGVRCKVERGFWPRL